MSDPFPLTRRWLGERAPRADDPAAFARAVCDAHARGDIPDRAVRDLARYELAHVEARETRPQAGDPPARVVLAPQARVVVYGAALPETLAALRAGATPQPRPARGWLVVWRDAKGPQELVLRREEGWLLESFREPAKVEDAVEDDEDRALVAWLWRAGLLVAA